MIELCPKPAMGPRKVTQFGILFRVSRTARTVDGQTAPMPFVMPNPRVKCSKISSNIIFPKIFCEIVMVFNETKSFLCRETSCINNYIDFVMMVLTRDNRIVRPIDTLYFLSCSFGDPFLEFEYQFLSFSKLAKNQVNILSCSWNFEGFQNF